MATAGFELAAAHSFNCATALPAALQSRPAPGLSLRGSLPLDASRSLPFESSVRATAAIQSTSLRHLPDSRLVQPPRLPQIAATFPRNFPSRAQTQEPFQMPLAPEYCVLPTPPAIRPQIHHRQFDKVKPVPQWCRAAQPQRPATVPRIGSSLVRRKAAPRSTAIA